MTEAREGSDHWGPEGGDLDEAYDTFLETLEERTDDEQDDNWSALHCFTVW